MIAPSGHETDVDLDRVWHYVYRTVEQHGQVIDVYGSARRDSAAARVFFPHAITSAGTTVAKVLTSSAPAYPELTQRLSPAAWHHREQDADNCVRADRAG